MNSKFKKETETSLRSFFKFFSEATYMASTEIVDCATREKNLFCECEV